MALTAVLAAASFGMQGLSSLAEFRQGQYANEQAKAEARQLQVQAQIAQVNAGQKIAEQDYRASHILSRITSVAAASGIESGEGSTAEVYNASAEEARINDMYTKYAANVESSQLEYQAQLTRSEGKQELAAAEIGAVTGLISGGMRSAGMYKYGSTGSGLDNFSIDNIDVSGAQIPSGGLGGTS